MQPIALAADDGGVNNANVAPPEVLETIHSKAQIARDRGDFEAVENLRLERLKAIDSLPASSAWKQGLDAIKVADGATQRMQYKKAVDILWNAWKPFDAVNKATSSEILFGDIAMKIFESMQAARAVYKPLDAAFPTLEETELQRLVNTAYESDPCQVELRAARAFLTQPDADETFLPQARRKSITRRNEDLLAIAYPEGKNVPIRPWHGPAQFLLGKNSSYVMQDLRFLKYLNPRTRIRGKDRVGEAFHLVYGGSVLCYGVSKRDAQQTGRSQVRFFVDDYRDPAWHRFRPYFMIVEPLDKSQKKTADNWELRSADVQRRVNKFVTQLKAAEKRLSQASAKPGAGTDQLPEVVTDDNVMTAMRQIIGRFRGPHRVQVQQATAMILSGQWQRPASDGTAAPPPGASLHDRLVFLAKGFRGYGQAYPALAEIANDAADDVEEIAKSLPKADNPAALDRAGVAAASRVESLSPGDDISTALSMSDAAIQMKSIPQRREDWEKRLSAVRVAGEGSAMEDDVDSLLSDYQLMLACRALEQCLYIRRQAFRDNGAAYGRRDEDFAKLFGPDYSVPPEGVTQVAPDAQVPAQDLTATLALLESSDLIASVRRDIQERQLSQNPTPLQLTEQARKEAFATLDAIQDLFLERARQLRSRDLEDIAVDRPLYRRWTTPEAKWSIYEIPHTMPPSSVADFLDNPLVPTLGLSEKSLNILSPDGDEHGVDPEETNVDLAEEVTLPQGTPLVRYKSDNKPLIPSLRLGISSGQLPLIAVVLVEHAVDDGDGGGAFDDQGGMHADTPEPHRLVHHGSDFKSEFEGCDGYVAAGFGKRSRRLVDRRGNTITMRSPDETTPFTVVSQTGQDISDGGDNVVYSWEAWQDLDQNVVNDFLPSTKFLSPSLPVWMTYREELLRDSPNWTFRWGAARASYYRPYSELLSDLRQQLGW
jgi:hypothetical protein